MKEYTDFEKHLVSEMLRIDREGGLNVIGNLLTKRFQDFSFYLKFDPKGSEIRITSEHIEQIGRSVRGLDRVKFIIEQSTKDVFTAVKLIEYLDQQGLIYTYGNLPLTNVGSEVHGATYASHRGLPKEVDELLERYIGKQILPTKTLECLMDRGFLSEEEHRFRQERRTSRITIAIAVLAVLATLASSIITAAGPTSVKVLNYPATADVHITEKTIADIRAMVEGESRRTAADRGDVLRQEAAGIKSELAEIAERLRSLESTMGTVSVGGPPHRDLNAAGRPAEPPTKVPPSLNTVPADQSAANPPAN